MLDWLAREGGALLIWWLLAALAGVAVYPLLLRLMGGLPSRGYPLARTAGLMLIGFVHWFLNILGLLRNDDGAMILAWLLVLVIGVVAFATWRDRFSIRGWLRENAGLVIATELLFLALFIGWAVVRAMNPNLVGTEKPMEMAFLSAIRRSATFPPHDPWLSGYAISYYHFGYIITAMLAELSGVSNGVAFNLMIPLLFALAGVGAFGVVYDLVALRLLEGTASRLRAQAAGLLASFFLIIMGNLGMIMLELPWQAGAFEPNNAYLQTLDIRNRPPDLTDCPPARSLDVNDWCYLWWWGYSRVVQDRTLTGDSREIITEFPQFSFILSDMHPHVLALPFTLLVMGLGLNLVMQKRAATLAELLLYAIWVGGMIFLNSWDAVYIVLYIGAEALRRLIWNGTGGFTRDDWWGIGRFTVILVALSGLIYAPFFISFRSQAGGVLPNVIWPTRFPQFFMMFGAFLIIIAFFLYAEIRRGAGYLNWRFALQMVGGALLVLLLALLGAAVIAWSRPELAAIVFTTIDQSGGLALALVDFLRRRIEGIPTHGVLVVFLFIVVARLFPREPRTAEGAPAETSRIITYSPSTGYALLLMAAGVVLALLPDFVYLRDGFGYRINMVFKLYYQAWALWSVGCAYACWSLLSEIKVKDNISPLARRAFAAVLVALIAVGALYAGYAIPTRAAKEGGHAGNDQQPWTLDGGPSLAMNPDDYAVIQCLAQVATADDDVVAEATRRGLAYNKAFGRVSALTGIPTLLGWDNHEGQWRGDTFDDALNTVLPTGGVESRYDAIAKLYGSTDWGTALDVIKRYGITYIYVGPTERSERNFNGETLFDPAGLAKFDGLKPVCQSGDTAVYSVESIPAQPGSPSGS